MSDHRAPVLGRAGAALEPSDLARVVASLARSEAIVYPTETLYGLGAKALDAEAVRRVQAIKGRADDKPFPLLVADRDMLASITGALTDRATALMDRYWPGALTLVLPGRAGLPPGICGERGSVACRLSSSPVATAIVTALGSPLIATSANRTGAPAHHTLSAALDEIGEEVSLAIDGGELPGRLGSTIVDLTGPQARVLRIGDLVIDPALLV